MKNTLTLKSISKNNSTHGNPVPTIQMQGGMQPKKVQQKLCSTLLDQLTVLIDSGSKVFIQMRNGTGYCGKPIKLEDGWITMSEVSIFGTKQTASSTYVLIQINNGSFIAHLHPVDSLIKIGT